MTMRNSTVAAAREPWMVAGPVLLGFGFLQGNPLQLTLPQAMLLLGCLFLVGACVLLFAPETRGQPLPE